MKLLKLYTAGPEVFLPNPLEEAKKQHRICQENGFIALHPMDNEIRDFAPNTTTAMRIYLANMQMIRDCDIVVANCNPFRGICMDDGTAYELGAANALGKSTYGYVSELTPLVRRITRDYPCRSIDTEKFAVVDREGYHVEDFGLSINLMMQCGILHSKGRLIKGNFENCVAAIRHDLDSGELVL